MKKYYSALMVFAFLGLAACGDDKESDEGSESGEESAEETQPVEPEEECIYEFDTGETTIEWTGYKHSTKVAVPGVFNSKGFSGGSWEGATPEEVLTSISGTVNPESIYSADTTRDRKLWQFFFAKMADSTAIWAKVVDIQQIQENGDERNGRCTVEIEMNGETQNVQGEYSIKDTEVTVSMVIDVLDWGTQDAFDSLSEACALKHTLEADGEPITWSEVAIKVSTVLIKKCGDELTGQESEEEME